MALRDIPAPMYVQTTEVSNRFKALKKPAQLVFYKTLSFNPIVFCPVRSIIPCGGIDSFFFFFLHFILVVSVNALYTPGHVISTCKVLFLVLKSCCQINTAYNLTYI